MERPQLGFHPRAGLQSVCGFSQRRRRVSTERVLGTELCPSL